MRTAGWTWLLVYAYALQIFFDFSGYTDIAIGLGRLLGIRLPENFNAPYLKPNLTQFWNNWHMTLTQWFRAYFFNPLTRALRTGRKAAAGLRMMLHHPDQHHGADRPVARHHLELCAVGRVARAGPVRAEPLVRVGQAAPARPEQRGLPNARPVDVLGVLLTFHYVALGWVWFALPSLPLSCVSSQSCLECKPPSSPALTLPSPGGRGFKAPSPSGEGGGKCPKGYEGTQAQQKYFGFIGIFYALCKKTFV